MGSIYSCLMTVIANAFANWLFLQIVFFGAHDMFQIVRPMDHL